MNRLFVAIVVSVFLTPSYAEVPRMPWGSPDLTGLWTTATLTPLERPEGLEQSKKLSANERQEMETRAEQTLQNRASNPGEGNVGGYNREWLDPGMRALDDGRVALIVDPANGRIPWKAAAKEASDMQRARYGVGPFDTYSDLDTGERCLSDGITMAPLQPYNMNYQIFQTEAFVAINHEMYHEYRIIPIVAADAIVTNPIPQWLGNAHGYWQGDTLVVISKGFSDKSHYYWAWPWRSSRPSLLLTERFTRIDDKTMSYLFTVEDDQMFTQAWTASAPMTTDQASRGVTAGPLFEFACHEGNYALPNVLRGARMQEALAEENK